MAKEIIPQEVLASKIFLIRGQKVMLDRDLAALYGVETKTLNRTVRRSIKRFLGDYMLKLTSSEAGAVSRCQIDTLKQGQNVK